jgi:hypothetical protein
MKRQTEVNKPNKKSDLFTPIYNRNVSDINKAVVELTDLYYLLNETEYVRSQWVG